MERVYQKTRTRANTAYAPSGRRSAEPEKPLFSVKKLAAQAIVSIVIFSLIYTVNLFDNAFCKAVNNEVAYTLNYTVDLQNAYRSSEEVIRYLSGGIEQGRIYINNAVAGGAVTPTAAPETQPDMPQPQENTAEASAEAAEPQAAPNAESETENPSVPAE